MRLAHAGRSEQQQVGGLGHKGQVGQFLDLPLVDGRLEPEVELLQGPPEGEMRDPCPRGEIPLPARDHFNAQQAGQHLGVGQLLVGGGVQAIVQCLDGLLESQALQVLAGLFQGNHRSPPAASS